MVPVKQQMHNCKRNGFRNRKESTTGKTKTIHRKINNMQTKLQLLLKWDRSWRMKQRWKKIKWWTKWKNTTKCLPKRREIENLLGSLINNLRMLLKLREPTWVISCRKISALLNLNLLHIDSYHITSKGLEKNKLKILLPKEMAKLLMQRLPGKTNAPRNTSGQSKICQIHNINSITNSTFKIDKNKLMLTNVMLTLLRETPRMPDGQTCMVIWTNFQVLLRTWLPQQVWDQFSE